MDKNKCPILIFSKNFCEFYCVFLNETEKWECNYYFCNEYICGNKKIIFMFLFNLSVKKE
jgi:hypothetical protein